VVRLGLEEFRSRLAEPGGADGFGGEPVVVVDVGEHEPGIAGDAVVPTGGERDSVAASTPTVFVATGPGAASPRAGAFDVVAVDDAAVARIVEAVEQAPLASAALVLLLRGAARRTTDDGLIAESSTYSLLQAGPEHRRWLAARPAPRARADETPPVRIERAGETLHLTLDRPAVHNAYSAAMRDALIDGLAIAEADPGVRVVIDATGPSFCSGGDLDEFGTTPDPATAHVIRLRRSTARAIAAVAGRVTVRAHGACVGAGVELPAFAGRVEAHTGARFWLPEVRMGLVPGAGGTVGITRRIGRQRAALLALTGDRIDAATAFEWGLVDAVVDRFDGFDD
jgi:enoyl-CoA hydratase/carnithine racemase